MVDRILEKRCHHVVNEGRADICTKRQAASRCQRDRCRLFFPRFYYPTSAFLVQVLFHTSAEYAGRCQRSARLDKGCRSGHRAGCCIVHGRGTLQDTHGPCHDMYAMMSSFVHEWLPFMHHVCRVSVSRLCLCLCASTGTWWQAVGKADEENPGSNHSHVNGYQTGCSMPVIQSVYTVSVAV